MKNSPLNFSSIEDLKNFFKNRVKVLHPDRGGNHQEYIKFIEWYQTILKNFKFNKKRAQVKILKHYQPSSNSIYKIEEFTIKELALALPKVIKLPLYESLCRTCEGRGFLSRGEKRECNFCQGKGILKLQQGDSENYIELKCHVCQGKGDIYKEKCPYCFGKGKIKEEVEVEIKLPPGLREGDILFISGENFSVNWDFFIEVVLVPNPLFRLEKDRLIYDLKIPFIDILLKEKVIIDTLEGKEEIPTSLLKKGGPIIFPGRGPYLRECDFWKRGDLVVEVSVIFPEKIPDRAKKLLDKFLKIMEVEENGRKGTS